MRGLTNWTWGILTVLVLLLSACTKEAPEGPCSQHSATGSEKRGSEGSDPSASSDDEGSDAGIDDEIDGDDGISDDGDDEADNERNKKKPISPN